MKKVRILLILILIFEIGCFFYKETNDIVINSQEIKDNDLRQSLGNVSVIQISDLHVKGVGLKEKRLIEKINKINPEIIFFTGDFISDNQGIKPCIQVIKEIASGRLVIAIFGNSDHSYKKKNINTELLGSGLETAGVRVLKNQSLRLTIRKSESGVSNSIYIVGLDDNYLWLDDIFKALNNVPEEETKILLAHSPNIIEKVDTKGINLILSGHTHGGQIVFPFFGAIYTNPVCYAKKKFVSGLYNEDTMLYVNRGIGTVDIPLRLFCKPEITILKFI